jgi:DNA polymerase-1
VADRPQTFVAVDGTALAYRSHFAFIDRPLTTRDGQVTSAVFGFVLALRRILDTLKPDAVVVVFDPPGRTFRHEMFADYKATRERMPEDLRSQLPLINEYLDAAGVPRLSIDGVEADDVLATLALRAAETGMTTRIVSNDKDLLQVVGGDVAVVTLGKASEPPRVMGAADVEEAFGVPPDKIVDFLALTGDNTDNVPGVPGVGRKTAAKLLREHGTLDALLAGASRIAQPKLRESLVSAKDDVAFSRDLVRLRTDLDAGDPRGFRPRDPDGAALDELFDRLDFQSLREARKEPAARRSDVAAYERVDSVAGLEKLADRLRETGRFAFRLEASEEEPRRAEIVGISFAWAEARAAYVAVAHRNSACVPWDDARRLLGPLLADASIPKWTEDAKRAHRVLERHGVEPRSIDFDTMLASYVLDPSRKGHGLADLARERLHLATIPREEITGSGRSRVPLEQAPLADVVRWAGEAADVAWRLRGVLEPELDAAGLTPVLRDIEMPLTSVLRRMESTGVRLDVDYLGELSREMEQELAALTERTWTAAGKEFNLGSPKQVAELLFETLGLKPRRRTKTGYSTDSDVLVELRDDHEVPGLILRHREVAKLKSTYVDALPAMVDRETGRLHTCFNQAVAATGRLSSSDPNLQNVPIRTPEGRRIRKAFVTEPGWVLVSCDYSQIELRILAHMAQDEALLEAFREDLDVHRTTAALVFDVPPEDVTDEQRGQAKTINYAVIYGMGAVNLGRSLGIPTRDASRFIEAYFDRYPGVRGYIDRTQAAAREERWVETLAGRRRPVPEIASRDHRTRAFGERIAVNTPIQGTAADILKLAMIRVQESLDDAGLAGRMLLTVHDELVLECPRAERDDLTELVADRMAHAMELAVPLKVDTGWGKDWSEAH